MPPPYGGIIKRCLLHAKVWRDFGAEVFIHIYHKHKKENDLGAGAQYFYDFKKSPNLVDKFFFIFSEFLSSPLIFLKLLFLQINLCADFKFFRFLYCAAKGALLDKKVKQINPDVIITETGGLQSLVALAVAKKNKIPVVLENYAEIQFMMNEKGENFVDKYHKFWDFLINGVDLVVSASEHCSLGPKKYTKDSSKLKIIYSGINFKIFNGEIGANKFEARKEFNLPQDKFLIMAVGALKFRKGHDQLLEALLKFNPPELKKIEVVLCGMGSAQELKTKASEIGFPQENIKIFQGLTEEVLARLYSAVDCFCFPSMTPRECMGMAMKEAMAIGLPIVAYNSGGIKEAIENNINGILVPTGDKESLALGVKKIINMTISERNFFTKNNIIKSSQMFDIEKTARQLFDEILKLIKQR